VDFPPLGHQGTPTVRLALWGIIHRSKIATQSMSIPKLKVSAVRQPKFRCAHTIEVISLNRLVKALDQLGASGVGRHDITVPMAPTPATYEKTRIYLAFLRQDESNEPTD
jgi:hypothetical protein